MGEKAAVGRTCPKCNGDDYVFRGWKKVVPQPGQGAGEVVETKYACKGCGHTWKDRAENKAA